MKRIFSFVVTKVSLLVLAALVFAGVITPAVSAAVQDFEITSYTTDYFLSKDNEGRSRMTVKEVIVAEFPNYDQNHGLERAIPQSYDGHPVSLKVTGVKKQDGSPWNYSTSMSNDNLVLRIGDADRYVHGKQTYVIEYEQRDVTRYFADTDSDELYWDTNGVEWRVPIRNFSATIHIDDSIADNLSGDSACYVGSFGTTDRCDIERGDSTFKVAAQQLAPGENVTVAVGFEPRTFAAYQQTWLEKVLSIVVPIWSALFIAAVGAGAWLVVRYKSLSSRSKELGTIVPEYIPPGEASVTTSASIIEDGHQAVFAAQLIDFAVRHYIKIYEIDKKWIFGSKDYEIEIIKDISGLKTEEQEILKDIFSSDTTVGRRLAMSSLKNNNSVYMNTLDNDKKIKALVRGDYGLQARNQEVSTQFKKYGKILLITGVLTLHPGLLIAGALAYAFNAGLYPLTDKGLALSRYLRGLKMYIEVAEADRLKMLQSPDGAAKVGSVDPNDPKQLVTLYERVLPYAVLFGLEKQWNAQLGKYYESMKTQPDWYSSNAAFSAATFGSAMSSFSTTSSYTSASSSSSGGSSGGGSSGGGGGGGGGGGW